MKIELITTARAGDHEFATGKIFIDDVEVFEGSVFTEVADARSVMRRRMRRKLKKILKQVTF